jgi:predicted RND superfamily exporter protein
MASLGQLLTLGIALMLIANLLVLPALIALVGGRAGSDAPPPPAPRD